MKKMLLLLSLTIGVLAISSCGKDGKDGNSYMTVSRGGNCLSSYWDDNSCLPTPCNYETSYGPCSNNTEDVKQFNYTFYFCSGSGYTGTYSIGFSLANGTKGGFLHRGDDGEDKYFTVTTSTSGLVATYKDSYVDNSNSVNPKSIISSMDTTKSNFDTFVDCGNYKMHIVGKKIWKKPGEIVPNKMAN